ncbi:hypothetical protein DFH11DRAFT_1743488 [Phellopilus nigrolimitatus]|nr:hypothetical protein DFH11DRAFT_1743488 [Phellopilus nigrolimitatus]
MLGSAEVLFGLPLGTAEVVAFGLPLVDVEVNTPLVIEHRRPVHDDVLLPLLEVLLVVSGGAEVIVDVDPPLVIEHSRPVQDVVLLPLLEVLLVVLGGAEVVVGDNPLVMVHRSPEHVDEEPSLVVVDAALPLDDDVEVSVGKILHRRPEHADEDELDEGELDEGELLPEAPLDETVVVVCDGNIPHKRPEHVDELSVLVADEASPPDDTAVVDTSVEDEVCDGKIPHRRPVHDVDVEVSLLGVDEDALPLVDGEVSDVEVELSVGRLIQSKPVHGVVEDVDVTILKALGPTLVLEVNPERELELATGDVVTGLLEVVTEFVSLVLVLELELGVLDGIHAVIPSRFTDTIPPHAWLDDAELELEVKLELELERELISEACVVLLDPEFADEVDNDGELDVEVGDEAVDVEGTQSALIPTPTRSSPTPHEVVTASEVDATADEVTDVIVELESVVEARLLDVVEKLENDEVLDDEALLLLLLLEELLEELLDFEDDVVPLEPDVVVLVLVPDCELEEPPISFPFRTPSRPFDDKGRGGGNAAPRVCVRNFETFAGMGTFVRRVFCGDGKDETKKDEQNKDEEDEDVGQTPEGHRCRERRVYRGHIPVAMAGDWWYCKLCLVFVEITMEEKSDVANDIETDGREP